MRTATAKRLRVDARHLLDSLETAHPGRASMCHAERPLWLPAMRRPRRQPSQCSTSSTSCWAVLQSCQASSCAGRATTCCTRYSRMTTFRENERHRFSAVLVSLPPHVASSHEHFVRSPYANNSASPDVTSSYLLSPLTITSCPAPSRHDKHKRDVSVLSDVCAASTRRGPHDAAATRVVYSDGVGASFVPERVGQWPTMTPSAVNYHPFPPGLLEVPTSTPVVGTHLTAASTRRWRRRTAAQYTRNFRRLRRGHGRGGARSDGQPDADHGGHRQ
jgi:hypothetical protein